MPRRHTVLAPALIAACLATPAPALATFHEMSIREVYPGSSAAPEAEYVELQMWAAGQNHVGGHVLKTYDASGNVTAANTFAADVAEGANQSTILLATPAAEAEFGVSADTGLASGNELDPSGGAACWETLDCVSWGDFNGSLPSPAGSPAVPAGIPDGMALRRTITPGCPTLLEPTDDRDNSAADFSPVFPAPRPNSVAPSEHRCAAVTEGGATGPAGGSQQGAPQTKLSRKPPKRTRDRTPSFRFSSSEPGSSFQCKLDHGPFRRCKSPFTSKRLSLGPHVFRVRARDRSGELDPSPAAYGFEVIAKRRRGDGMAHAMP
jgi:hypothetical protein